MPFCTIEEAWGENIYKTNTETGFYKDNVLYTDVITNSNTSKDIPKHTKPIENNNSDIESQKSKEKNDINLTKYIDKLKQENEELKNIISKHTIEKDNEKNSFKFKLIDILIYILTGIFIIFITDLMLRHNPTKPYIQDNIF